MTDTEQTPIDFNQEIKNRDIIIHNLSGYLAEATHLLTELEEKYVLLKLDYERVIELLDELDKKDTSS